MRVLWPFLVLARLSSAFQIARTIHDGFPARRSRVTTRLFSSKGLYRPVAEASWDKIRSAFPSLVPPEKDTPCNVAPAKGLPDSVVRMETRALVPDTVSSSEQADCPVRYARMAILETVPSAAADDDNEQVHTPGIQVLNLVVLPDKGSSLPVWGADFVSLPGDRHLLFLDAQPMVVDDEDIVQTYENNWKDWRELNIVQSDLFPWGGDLPEPVQPFVSANALWTRFGPDDEPLQRIQGPLKQATEDHLDLYLKLLLSQTLEKTCAVPNQQDVYVKYRLENDPARPMLKALYGEEWSENVLQQVLFPQD